MSIKVMSHVWDHSRHGTSALLLLLAIADYADPNGWAWPSIATLANRARLSPRNVKRLLHKLTLEPAPELQIKRGAGPNGCNLYRICLPLKGGGDNLTPPCTSEQVIGGDIQGLGGDIAVSPDPSVDPSEENTQTAHAREEDPVCGDAEESPAEDEAPPDTEAITLLPEPIVDPEPQPLAEPQPEAEPEPQAEAFAWEAPTCTYDPIVPCTHYRETLAAIEPLVPFRVTGNGSRVHEEVFEAVHRLSVDQITRIYDYRLAQRHSPEVLYPSVTLARKSLDKWVALSESWMPLEAPADRPCPHYTWDLHWEGNRQRCKCGEWVGDGVDREEMRAFVEHFAPSGEEPQDA